MELNERLVEKAESMGINIKDNCSNLTDLVKLLPKYIFIDKRLWCGNISVDAEN